MESNRDDTLETSRIPASDKREREREREKGSIETNGNSGYRKVYNGNS